MSKLAQKIRTNRPRVLIVSDEAEFSRNLIMRWQMERTVPEFTVIGSEVARQADISGQALIILDSFAEAKRESFLANWHCAPSAILCLTEENGASPLRAERSRMVFVRKTENWLDSLASLGAEGLKRYELNTRLEELERQLQASQHHATLGHYMVEIRHDFNNTLTSILGNAELLLQEEASLNSEMKDQVETIHSMALRLFEMMQRFSSLETEMRSIEKKSQSETKRLSQSAGSA